MGYHNIFAQRQLLEIYKELTEELSKIRCTEEDNELDRELKYGARGALELAIGIVHNKIEWLQNEQK